MERRDVPGRYYKSNKFDKKSLLNPTSALCWPKLKIDFSISCLEVVFFIHKGASARGFVRRQYFPLLTFEAAIALLIYEFLIEPRRHLITAEVCVAENAFPREGQLTRLDVQR
jgi:hypothetical protein